MSQPPHAPPGQKKAMSVWWPLGLFIASLLCGVGVGLVFWLSFSSYTDGAVVFTGGQETTYTSADDSAMIFVPNESRSDVACDVRDEDGQVVLVEQVFGNVSLSDNNDEWNAVGTVTTGGRTITLICQPNGQRFRIGPSLNVSGIFGIVSGVLALVFLGAAFFIGSIITLVIRLTQKNK